LIAIKIRISVELWLKSQDFKPLLYDHIMPWDSLTPIGNSWQQPWFYGLQNINLSIEYSVFDSNSVYRCDIIERLLKVVLNSLTLCFQYNVVKNFFFKFWWRKLKTNKHSSIEIIQEEFWYQICVPRCRICFSNQRWRKYGVTSYHSV
jgi:hypothetical protein